MKDLIDVIIAFLQAGITGGDINIGGIKTNNVLKGFNEDPTLIPFTQMPYIAIEDGGERTEDANDNSSQNRFYSVLFDIATYDYTKDKSIDTLLDLYNQVKAVTEAESNRKKDGLIFGRDVTTYDWTDNEIFFRGRTFVVDYIELETTYFNY